MLGADFPGVEWPSAPNHTKTSGSVLYFGTLGGIHAGYLPHFGAEYYVRLRLPTWQDWMRDPGFGPYLLVVVLCGRLACVVYFPRAVSSQPPRNAMSFVGPLAS